MKPNTQEQIDRINVEIRKKSRRWIYYNALSNPPDMGWLRDRACDSCELHLPSELRYQLTPPRVRKGYIMVINGKLVIIGPRGEIIRPGTLPDAPRRVISKRDAKAHAKGPRHDRAKAFQWCMLTAGKNPPTKNAWGIP